MIFANPSTGAQRAALRLADIWKDLPRAVGCVTQTAGLPDRGRLEAGLRGDVIRVRLAGNTLLLGGVWSRGQRVA